MLRIGVKQVGAEKIIDRIITDAQKKADEIMAAANAEANAIKAEAEAAKTSKISEGAQLGEKEAQFIKSRIVASAHMEAKKLLLQKKQALLAETFDNARSRLEQMNNDEFEALMQSLLVSLIETGDEEVVISNADKGRLSADFIDKVNKTASSRLKLSSEDTNIPSGSVLKRGDIEINATFDAIFRQKKEELSADIAKILF